MKIDEPKTPYNYQDPALNDFDQLDAGTLTEKLKVAADSTSADAEEDGARARNFYSEEEEAGDSEEDAEEKVPETDEQKGESLFCLVARRVVGDGDKRRKVIAELIYFFAWYRLTCCIAIECVHGALHLPHVLPLYVVVVVAVPSLYIRWHSIVSDYFDHHQKHSPESPTVEGRMYVHLMLSSPLSR